MPYEAVSAYTVLVGETGSPTTVTVHGSADEAWQALAEAVRSRSSRWLPRGAEAAALADRWRREDPERRFWQVSAHRLQVMVPTTGTILTRPTPPSAEPPQADYSHRHWRSRRRMPSPHSAG
ncbi:MAG: hypothetical protein ACRDTG_13230 [Pseudonocardiaceae bacterium]